jgi:hypothetical protein
MKIQKYALAINSGLIMLAASLLITILHESAHYFTAISMGLTATLHHNYVDHQGGTPEQQMMIAAAGPLFSLILGIIGLVIALLSSRASLANLFFLWFGIMGWISFFGYLLIAPFIKEGDTGKVMAYFAVPMIWQIVILVVSTVFMIWLLSWLAPEFSRYKATAVFNQIENSRQLFNFPIFFLIIAGTLANLPAPHWPSLLPGICMPMSYFTTMGAYRGLKLNDAELWVDRVSTPVVVMTIIVIIVFRLLV